MRANVWITDDCSVVNQCTSLPQTAVSSLSFKLSHSAPVCSNTRSLNVLQLGPGSKLLVGRHHSLIFSITTCSTVKGTISYATKSKIKVQTRDFFQAVRLFQHGVFYRSVGGDPIYLFSEGHVFDCTCCGGAPRGRVTKLWHHWTS